MNPAAIATPSKESPLLFEGLTWREFKAVEQLLDRPRYRLSLVVKRIGFRAIIRAINRCLRISSMGMHRTLEAIVVGEELTTRTGNLVHLLRLGYAISKSRP